MAYNSLKRIFGETKLELKLLFLFGVGLLVIIVTASGGMGEDRQLVYEKNQDTGRAAGSPAHAREAHQRDGTEKG